MELQYNNNGYTNDTKSWYGSKTSCQNTEKSNENVFMTFQSKDPIILIPMNEKIQTNKSTDNITIGAGHNISVKHPTSYIETLMHLFKGNVGSGIFAMGDAIKNAGILLGPGIVLLLGLICLHCQHLLLSAAKKMEINKDIKVPPDFAETVQLCFANGPQSLQRFSKLAKRIVNILLCVTQLGFCCVYFVFISENVKQVFDYYGYTIDVHFHMAIILLPILLTCLLRNLKFLAPLSTIANIFMIVGIIITFYYCVRDGLPSIDEREYVAQPYQFPLFFGTALFAFEGIGLVLPLQNEMKKPENFKRPLGVLNMGMGLVSGLYIITGFLAYLKYGNEVLGSVTLNLPQHEILAQSVKLIISLGILLTYALQFYIAVDIMFPNVVKALGPFEYPVMAELIFRSTLVLITFVLAEAIPFLNLFISLVGAVSSSALALLIPPILNIVTCYSVGDISLFTTCKDTLIFLIGIVGCVTGTFESISAIVDAFKSSA